MRDRNHPCVVVWSIGNEIEELSGKQGRFVARTCEVYERFRPQIRPDAPGGDGLSYSFSSRQGSMFDSLDLTGWNYQRRYGPFRKQYPDKPIIYSESASALSTRGFYELPLKQCKDAVFQTNPD